jgi:hypothetical protein
MACAKARTSERRLKFSSIRRLESHNETQGAVAHLEPAKRGSALAAVGGILAAAYVAVARKVLLGFEAVEDSRAARRAVVLRGSARANAASLARSDASSPSVHSNS